MLSQQMEDLSVVLLMNTVTYSGLRGELDLVSMAEFRL